MMNQIVAVNGESDNGVALMPYVQVNGTEIYYLNEGSGAPLFFIHGLGINSFFIPPDKTDRLIVI